MDCLSIATIAHPHRVVASLPVPASRHPVSAWLLDCPVRVRMRMRMRMRKSPGKLTIHLDFVLPFPGTAITLMTEGEKKPGKTN